MKPLVTKFLMLDAEYGGTDRETNSCLNFSLLDLYLEITDKDLNRIDSLSLKIKPDTGPIKYSDEGLQVNKINLLGHERTAINQSEAARLTLNFINQHSEGGRIKLIPCGKGIGRDIQDLLDRKFIEPKVWYKHCAPELIDLGSLALILKIYNHLPQTYNKRTNKLSNSLETLAHFFKIPLKHHHSAEGDVKTYKDLFKSLLTIMGLKK